MDEVENVRKIKTKVTSEKLKVKKHRKSADEMLEGNTEEQENK